MHLFFNYFYEGEKCVNNMNSHSPIQFFDHFLLLLALFLLLPLRMFASPSSAFLCSHMIDFCHTASDDYHVCHGQRKNYRTRRVHHCLSTV